MMFRSPDSFSEDSQEERNDPVWRLLGESPRQRPDAWFTVRALARCRQSASGAITMWGGVWRWVLGGGLSICLAVGLAVTHLSTQAHSDRQEKVQEAFEIVASLDTSDADTTPSSPDSSL